MIVQKTLIKIKLSVTTTKIANAVLPVNIFATVRPVRKETMLNKMYY